MKPLLLTSIFAACAALIAPTAHAQAFDTVRLHAAAPGKEGGLAGAVLLVGREYAGSDERRTQLLGVLDYQWANGWFAGTTNGIGVNFSDTASAQYGLRLTADLGREERRSSALAGMGDVPAKLEIGGFYNQALTRELSLTSSVRYGSGRDGKGLVADLGAAYATQIAPQWRLRLGAGVSLANAEYLQSYFGVTASQSVSSGYRSYSPQAGMRSGRANLTMVYMASPRWSVTTGLSITTLLGDAQSSPLVRKKSSLDGLLATAYAF